MREEEDSREAEGQVVDRKEREVEDNQEAEGQMEVRMEREVEGNQEAEGQVVDRMEANLLQAKLVPTDPNLVATNKQAKANDQVTIR